MRRCGQEAKDEMRAEGTAVRPAADSSAAMCACVLIPTLATKRTRLSLSEQTARIHSVPTSLLEFGLETKWNVPR